MGIEIYFMYSFLQKSERKHKKPESFRLSFFSSSTSKNKSEKTTKILFIYREFNFKNFGSAPEVLYHL